MTNACELARRELSVGNVYIFSKKNGSCDKILVRFVGRDERDRIILDSFRIRPAIDASRDVYTDKQFDKSFREYEIKFADIMNEDKDWDYFLDFTYHQYLYQKLF